MLVFVARNHALAPSLTPSIQTLVFLLDLLTDKCAADCGTGAKLTRRSIDAQRKGVTVILDLHGVRWVNFDYYLINAMLRILQVRPAHTSAIMTQPRSAVTRAVSAAHMSCRRRGGFGCGGADLGADSRHQGPLVMYQALLRPKLLKRVEIVPFLPAASLGTSLPAVLGGAFNYSAEHHVVGCVAGRATCGDLVPGSRDRACS